MPNPVYTIKIEPQPLPTGGTGTVTYDGPPGTVIKLDWGNTTVNVVIGEDGSATFDVPKGAQSLIAVDPWGNTGSSTVSP